MEGEDYSREYLTPMKVVFTIPKTFNYYYVTVTQLDDPPDRTDEKALWLDRETAAG